MSFRNDLTEKYQNMKLSQYPKEWTLSELSEVTIRVKVGFVGSCERYYCDETIGIPMIRTTNLSSNGIQFNDLKYVTNEFHSKNKKSQLKYNDVLVARHGENGKACIYKSNREANCLNVVVIEPDVAKLLPDYVKYLFDSEIVKIQITASIVGSVQNVVNTKTIANLLIPYPPVNMQKSTVKVLSTFDEKIEVNNQINKTLETMAQALFKQWFIDFEFPNENGDPYKSSGGEMIESELGLIPKGWEVQSAHDFLESVSVKHRFPNDKIVFLNTSDIHNGEVLLHKETLVEGLPGQAKKSIQKHDILYSEIRPQNRRFAYVDFEAENYVVSTKLMVLRTKQFPSSLAYYLLVRDETITALQITAESRSGTFPQITFDNLKYVRIAVPKDLSHLEQITSLFDNSLKVISERRRENVKLQELRDTILPKLMSGEIRVPIEEN